MNPRTIEKVESKQAPEEPMNRPNDMAEMKPKKGKIKISRYIVNN
jgi:hypothetical protein